MVIAGTYLSAPVNFLPEEEGMSGGQPSRHLGNVGFVSFVQVQEAGVQLWGPAPPLPTRHAGTGWACSPSACLSPAQEAAPGARGSLLTIACEVIGLC